MTTETNPAPVLTPELCRATKDKLIFRPQSVDEAAFIGEQLQNMGFRYYNAKYPDQLQIAVEGCMYLDTDKTIMLSSELREGMACSIDGFTNFFISSAQIAANARLSPEDCLHKTLAFYPRSNGEARGILSALFKAGVKSPAGDENIVRMTAGAVVYGMLVREGRVSFGPSPQDLCGAEICSALDIGVRPAGILSAEQATVMAAFNEMAARVEQMSQRLARLEKEILPAPLHKTLPPPKRPGPES